MTTRTVRKWWLTGVLLALAVPAAAETTAAFERVPTLHWAYDSVRGLERHGISTGSPESTFAGKRRVTRYEFAVATGRLVRNLQDRLSTGRSNPTAGQDLLQAGRLVHEFGPELTSLGTDPAELSRQLDSLTERWIRSSPRPSPIFTTEAPLPESPRFARPPNEGAFGLRAALGSGLRSDALDRDLQRGTLNSGGSGKASLAAGPLRAAVAFSGADRLGASDRQPYEDPRASLSYQAELAVELRGMLLTGYYGQVGGLTDRFGLWNTAALSGPTATTGGSLRGDLNHRLAFELEAATLRPQDEINLLRYLRGELNFNVRGLTLGLGFERLQQLGLQDGIGQTSSLTLGVRRAWGRWLQAGFQLRYNPNRSSWDQSAPGTSSALGQVTFRY